MSLPSSRITRRHVRRPEPSPEEAARILWGAIEEAKMYVEDPTLTLEDKRRWAKTLADMIGVYNKLQAGLGERQLEGADLGTLLTRFPQKLRADVERRVAMWRRKSL